MSAIRSSRWLGIIALLVSFCIGNPVACDAEQHPTLPVETVRIPVSPLPFVLQGLLRRPEGAGHFPAVVLLPACGEFTKPLDEDWGTRLSSWGFVTLTLDGFGPRGIHHCGHSVTADYPDLAPDAYLGLNFLVAQSFVDSRRVALVGFAWGAWETLAAVERGEIEQAHEHKFRAAAAFFPFCDSFKGVLTVPALVLIGERDDAAAAEACRKMVNGEDDMGISRQKGEGAPVRLITYPDATFAFDLPPLKAPTWYRGHRAEFNKSADDQSGQALRDFLMSAMPASLPR
jgi:dienelactone hydrolase